MGARPHAVNSSHWVNIGCCTQNSSQINAAPPKNSVKPGTEAALFQAAATPAGRYCTSPTTHTAASASSTATAPTRRKPATPQRYSTTTAPLKIGSGSKAGERVNRSARIAQAPQSRSSSARA